MPRFDPNQPFETPGAKFDPSQPFETVQGPKDVSKTESLLRGAGQGATLGFGDEESGALESGIGALDSLIRGQNNFGDQGRFEGLKNFVENYRRSRDEVRAQNEDAQRANPKMYTTGQIGGSIPLAIATSGLGEAGEGAGLGTKLWNSSKVGATYGALGGAGGSKADLTQGDVGGFAKDTGMGAGIGAVLGPTATLGFEGAQAAVNPIANMLSKSANVSRVAALGGGKAAVKKLLQKDEVQALGQQMKDDNIMGPFTSRAGIEKNLEAAQQGHGEAIGKVISAGDAANPQGIVPADKIAEKAIDEVWAPLAARSTTRKAADAVAQEIQSFEDQHGGQNLSLEDLQKFKKDIQDSTKVFDRSGDTPTSSGFKGLYNIFNKSGEEAISGLEPTVPQANLPAFQAAKQGYGLTGKGLKMVADRNAREMAGSAFNLPDINTGGTAAVVTAVKSHNPVLSLLMGLGGAALNKGVRGYGNQGAAFSKDILANILRGPVAKSAPVVNRIASPWMAQQMENK